MLQKFAEIRRILSYFIIFTYYTVCIIIIMKLLYVCTAPLTSADKIYGSLNAEYGVRVAIRRQSVKPIADCGSGISLKKLYLSQFKGSVLNLNQEEKQ